MSPSQSKGQQVNGDDVLSISDYRTSRKRSILTQEELERELEANMEQLEPASEYTKVNTSAANNSIQSEDLIAILEGDDGNDKAEQNERRAKEVEIAKKQIESLPKAIRGRRPKQPVVVAAATSTVVKTTDLIRNLVDDWSDNEESNGVSYEVTAVETKGTKETTITVVPKKPTGGASKRKSSQSTIVDTDPESGTTTVEIIRSPVAADESKQDVPVKFERKRVIKKKIIWDPDDPTPSFTSRIGSTTIKKVTTPKTKIEEPLKQEVTAPPVQSSITAGPLPVPKGRGGGKKRRLNEIDKLLADEGAINMIYELERENDGSNIPEIQTAVEEEGGYQVVDVDEEKTNLAKKAKLLKNAVIKQTSSPPAVIPARAPRAKRDLTPTSTPLTVTTSSSVSPPTKPVPTPVAAKIPKAAGAASAKAMESPTAIKKPTAAAAKKRKLLENEQSLIFRRRSTSSFSDPGSPRRMSLDDSTVSPNNTEASIANSSTPADTSITTVSQQNVSKSSDQPQVSASKKAKPSSGDFAKPRPGRKPRQKPLDTSVLVAQIKGKLGTKPPIKVVPKPEPPVEVQSPPIKSPEKKKLLDSKQLSIRKYDKFAFVIMPSIDGKLKDCLTLQLVNKIIAALKQLETEPSCNAVVLTSAGTNFCNGINYHLLIQTDEEKRKSAAREFAAAIR